MGYSDGTMRWSRIDYRFKEREKTWLTHSLANRHRMTT
jgi:hypothetical protein